MSSSFAAQGPWRPFADLPLAHGPVAVHGRLRVLPSDFQVEELLAFGPDGDGEHLLLRVRKTDANTDWTARALARLAGVGPRQVGYAGLKDRRAVTVQWFSIHLPGKPNPDWRPLLADGIEVLECHRHRRKLRRGLLAGNRFALLLREVTGPVEALPERLALIRRQGVPNWFGPQRFGHQSGNLRRAEALFAAEAAGRRVRVDPHQRGLWLSAVRSQLFNEVLALRVERGDWRCALPGERLQLFGSHSHFLATDIDERIAARIAAGDLLPTGPLFGAGPTLTAGAVAALEDQVAAAFPCWLSGLAAAGLQQERRALVLYPEGLASEQPEPGQLHLRFTLPAGAYATALLRELVQWQEPGPD